MKDVLVAAARQTVIPLAGAFAGDRLGSKAVDRYNKSRIEKLEKSNASVDEISREKAKGAKRKSAARAALSATGYYGGYIVNRPIQRKIDEYNIRRFYDKGGR